MHDKSVFDFCFHFISLSFVAHSQLGNMCEKSIFQVVWHASMRQLGLTTSIVELTLNHGQRATLSNNMALKNFSLKNVI